MRVKIFSFGWLLHQCYKTKAFRNGLTLHAAVVKTGAQADVIVSNHVLNMYAKSGNLGSARQVFDEMPDRNLVSWSAMISGYDQAGEPLMAIELFSQLRLVPNEFVFASAINACASLLALSQGQQVHAQSVKWGHSSISFVSNSLISMYMECGRFKDALSVFTCASEPNLVSYNAIITGLVENQLPESGFEVFKLLYKQGLVPDHFTFLGVLGICSDENGMQRGMELHCQAVKLNLDSTPFVGNEIITMYSKFKLIEEAEKVFGLIEEKDVISWNTLIAACSRCADHAKGLSVFKKMIKENGTRPDDFTYASALAACAGLVSIRHGSQIHAHLIRTRMDEDVGVCNALLNMYAKCGYIGYAHTVFRLMGSRDLLSWNSIIAGFGYNGLGEEALQIFEQMVGKGLKPDSFTFLGLLIACNHSGLADKGQDFFNSIPQIYGIAPNLEHFSCLVDLLGRAGRLKEAEEYLGKFPFGHDPVVLGSLLSACRLHGDVVIGERVGRRLQELKPVTTSPYVLLSNLYASDGLWDGAAEARKMMESRGFRKEPGHSLIEVKAIP